MLNSEVTIPVAILSLIRGDVSSRCLADRFGVTESLVNEWKDVFVVAGVLALQEHGRPLRRPARARGDEGGLSGATTTPECRGTTTPEATTTPETTTSEATTTPEVAAATPRRRRSKATKR